MEPTEPTWTAKAKPTGSRCTAKCAMDINGDGATNVTDVLAVLSAFGTACN